MESWTVKGSVSVVFAFYFLLFFFNYYKEQKGLEYTKSRIYWMDYKELQSVFTLYYDFFNSLFIYQSFFNLGIIFKSF